MRRSIVERNDKYYVVTDIAPGRTGKRRQKWHASYPTKKQAEKELRKVLVELDEDRYVEPSSRTPQAYLLEDWLPAMSTTLRASASTGR